MPNTELSEQDVAWVIQRATRAPSLHNTQPWRFESNGTRIDLYADPKRALPATDPFGRELIVSCGAALYNLRSAMRGLGFDCEVATFPTPGDPRWLASVIPTGRRTPTAEERRTLVGVMRRHTHRTGFDTTRTLDADIVVPLLTAATAEGAQLHLLSSGSRRRVIELTNLAAIDINVDPEVERELAEWTEDREHPRRDGVPPSAHPASEALSSDAPAARGFSVARGRAGTAVDDGADPPAIAVLTTSQDAAADWLIAGQALGRVLALAAQHWVFAALHSQITEVPSRREDLMRELGTPGYPQMVLGLGYSSMATSTPRRAIEEILTLTSPTTAPAVPAS